VNGDDENEVADDVSCSEDDDDDEEDAAAATAEMTPRLLVILSTRQRIMINGPTTYGEDEKKSLLDAVLLELVDLAVVALAASCC
jgi:hypothetical protein